MCGIMFVFASGALNMSGTIGGAGRAKNGTPGATPGFLRLGNCRRCNFKVTGT